MRHLLPASIVFLGLLLALEVAPGQIPGTPPPRLGITVESNDTGDLQVVGVEAGRPGALAGVRHGDIIRGLGGVVVRSVDDLVGALGGLKAGSSTTLSVQRGSRTLPLRVNFPAASAARTGPDRSRPRGPLAQAQARIRKALGRLDGAVDRDVVAQVRTDLEAALQALKRVGGDAPRGPVSAGGPAPKRGFGMQHIQKRIQELMASGASSSEIEDAISEEFGGQVQVHVSTSSDADGNDFEEIHEEVEKKAPTSRKSSSKSSKSSTSGNRKDLKRFLERMKKSASSRKAKKK